MVKLFNRKDELRWKFDWFKSDCKTFHPSVPKHKKCLTIPSNPRYSLNKTNMGIIYDSPSESYGFIPSLFDKILEYKLTLLQQIIEGRPHIIMGDFNSVYSLDPTRNEEFIQQQFSYFENIVKNEQLTEQDKLSIRRWNQACYELLIEEGYSYASPSNEHSLYTEGRGKTIVDTIWYTGLQLETCMIIPIIDKDDSFDENQNCISDHNPIYALFCSNRYFIPLLTFNTYSGMCTRSYQAIDKITSILKHNGLPLPEIITTQENNLDMGFHSSSYINIKTCGRGGEELGLYSLYPQYVSNMVCFSEYSPLSFYNVEDRNAISFNYKGITIVSTHLEGGRYSEPLIIDSTQNSIQLTDLIDLAQFNKVHYKMSLDDRLLPFINEYIHFIIHPCMPLLEMSNQFRRSNEADSKEDDVGNFGLRSKRSKKNNTCKSKKK
jgi:hypothetical protein